MKQTIIGSEDNSVEKGRTETTYKLGLFKTAAGYLHEQIGEGFWCEGDERNYSFTDNIFDAYTFSDESFMREVPKYIDVTHDQEINTREQLCEVLGGEFVTIEVKNVTTWKEI